MKRNMWKIAEGTKIPTSCDITYGEIVQLKERYESGERNAKFEALLTAFKYGFACAQRMEVNKRKRGGAK